MITTLAIEGYRSLRNVKVALGEITLVTGANGSGKSSLYRALRLLADIAQGRIIQSLGAEGGLQSTLWAGPETFSRDVRDGVHAVEGLVRKGPVSLKLGLAADDYGYAIDLGLPQHSGPFSSDPEIKLEALWVGQILGRANQIAMRKGPSVQIKNEGGEWMQAHTQLSAFDSMMTHCGNNRDAFELLHLRERMRGWRFYDQLRTDRDSPARKPQIGTYTPVLDSEGTDVAAAIQTIYSVGAREDFAATINDAFPSAEIFIGGIDGYMIVHMQQHGLLRPLGAAELSDGTLRYVMLAAALLSPNPPELMILNEPETSLHPNLLAPLGRLILKAAKRSQVIVVSHAPALIAVLRQAPEVYEVALYKELSETCVGDNDPPSWRWPTR